MPTHRFVERNLMSHLDLQLLQAVLDGDLPPKTVLRRLLAHLAELCPECREVLEALRVGASTGETRSLEVDRPTAPPRVAEAAALPDPRLVGVLNRAQDHALQWTQRVRREQRRARVDLRQLRELPPDQRARRIEQARTRFRSRGLAELLLEESQRLVREDADEARNLASLVEAVLVWTPGAIEQEWAREMLATARAYEANALRMSGDLRAADRMFAELRAQLAREVVVSEAVHGEVASLEASLRIDQGRLEEARGLLDRAAYLFREAGSTRQLVKVLMKQANVESRVGDLAAAVAVERRALALTEKGEARDLLASTVINLCFDLLELDGRGPAAELLEKHRPAMVDAGVWDWPQAQTLRGRLAFAAGDADEAERLFLAARAELIRRRDVVYAAVASFDLAVLYLSQGRTGELRRTARLMGQVFEAEDLHEEAMATVVLFQQAVAAESVTLEALRAWRRQLESGAMPARRQPARPS
jgi:tetratricopeptide (TPR) repeat protein